MCESFARILCSPGKYSRNAWRTRMFRRLEFQYRTQGPGKSEILVLGI